MRLLRIVALILVLLAVALYWSRYGTTRTSGKPIRRAKQKVVIMGFDGMDPTLARTLMDAGKLPSLKRLADGGTFSTLDTTQPSESPVAWASFATGVNPGKHNIYDFLARDLETYLPDFAGIKRTPAEFLWGLFPVKPPEVASTRGGESFWVHAGRDGIKSVVLTVPMTFPPEDIHHGQMLAGLPLGDIRDTLGTFYYWATDLSSFEEGNAEFGGTLKRLSFESGLSETLLKGPANPILMQEERELKAEKKNGPLSAKKDARLKELGRGKDIPIPVRLRWKPGQHEVTIEVQDTTLSLKAGEWSPWVPLSFRVNMLKSLQGMTQFYVVRADQDLQLYAAPVNLDPRDPPLPISKPDAFSAELAHEVGLYRTLGWAEHTGWPLQEGRLDESVFLYDCEKAFVDREKIILKNLERTDWDLFVATIETTDRISHMMWRLIDPKHPMYDADLAAKYGDSIETIYRRADGLVGRIQEKLPADAVLIVMSDHGFHSFRRSVNLNTWLVQNGYMLFQGQEAEKKTFEDLSGRGNFWEGVDWSRTRAYAVGLGQIYFNLRGRELHGIVSAGAEYRALQDEMAAKLLTLKDPEDGTTVMRAVYRRDDVYSGEYLQYAPDLQAGFGDGYRVGWQDTLGSIRRSVVENNNRKWSGDHCATAAEISGGVIFINRKLPPQPHIMDLAPTVLKLLEVPVPGGLDGKALL